MGCCSKQAATVAGESYASTNEKGVAPASTRKYRDCFCALLFVAFWLGMVVVAIIGLANGQPKRLLYGSDYNGTTCGTGGREAQPLTFYPRMSQDLMEQLMNASLTSPTQYSFYGVCVAACPNMTTYFCNYKVEARIQRDASLVTDADREQARKKEATKISLTNDNEC